MLFNANFPIAVFIVQVHLKLIWMYNLKIEADSFYKNIHIT